MVTEADYHALKKDFDALKRNYQKVLEENSHLREVAELYHTALSLTDHVISYVDIQEHSLHHIFREATFDAIHDVMENVPDAILDTGIIPPEDVETFRKFYDDVYNGKPSGESGIFKTTEGDRRGYVKMLYKTIFDENGRPSKAVVFSDDITSKVKAERHYLEFRNAVMSGSDYVWEINLSQDKILLEDQIDNQFLGRTDFTSYSDIIATSVKEVLPDYRNVVNDIFSINNLIHSYENGKREFTSEYPLKRADGSISWLHSKIYLLSNVDSDICAIICANDITERKAIENKLIYQAECDVLTGLLNRRSFQEYAEAYLEKSLSVSPVLMIVDVDNFKQMNDCWGHIFGDTVLKLIADTMRSSFRKADYIGRLGGDEFMILATDNIDEPILEDRIQNMQSMLKHIKTPENTYIDITLSIGAAKIHPNESFDSLYMRADRVLYDVKEHGKNGFKILYD